MKLFILVISFFLNSVSVFAGQLVCSDVNGNITEYSPSDNSRSGCLFFDIGPSLTQAKYDSIRTLFQTVEQKYIKVDASVPREMTLAEKTAKDSTLQTASNTSEIARIDNFDITGGELGRALASLINESTALTLASNTTLAKIKDKIKSQKGLI